MKAVGLDERYTTCIVGRAWHLQTKSVILRASINNELRTSQPASINQ